MEIYRGLSEEGARALLASDLDHEFIRSILAKILLVQDICDRWPTRATIEFPATKEPDEQGDQIAAIHEHWEEMSKRCQLATLSANETIHDLTRGLVDGLNSSNVLVVVLTARALLEHAASFHELTRAVSGQKEFLKGEVIPFLKGEKAGGRSSLHCPELMAELMRFQSGSRVMPDGTTPQSPTEWRNWEDRCIYRNNEKKESPSDRDEVDEPFVVWLLKALGLVQTNVMTYLGKIAKKSEMAHILGLYALLSEFCHPNADNRELAVVERNLTNDRATIEVARGNAWGPARKKGVGLGLIAIGSAVYIHVESCNCII